MSSSITKPSADSARPSRSTVSENEVRDAQSAVLRGVYTKPDAWDRFAQSYLWAPEVKILVRYRDDIFGRRVLDIGVGAGRTTKYLADLAAEYTGIDYSDVMVQATRKRFPLLRLENADVRDLSAFADSSFDCVFAPSAVLDALSHADRLRALAEIRRVLVENGLFAFSGHNRAAPRNPPYPRLDYSKDPLLLARYGLRWLREIAHRMKYRRYELETDDYAILNDASFEWRGLHYYCSREAQARQLEAAGFRLMECFAMDGLSHEPGRVSMHDYKLHYVCRTTSARQWAPRRESRRRHERRRAERRAAQSGGSGV